MKKFEKTYKTSGNDVKVTVGDFGFRADSAVRLQQGETVVMAFVTVDKADTTLDYFPLGINYIEKFYAGGIISGSRFKKREGRPSDDAVVKARVIDRGMRPLFPVDFKKEVSIVVNVMSYDEENDPHVLSANAAALAIHMSSVPFNGPVGFVRVGIDRNSGELIVDPTNGKREDSMMDAIISANREAITQIELEGEEIPEEKISNTFAIAFEKAQLWNDVMDDVRKELGKEKLQFGVPEEKKELVEEIGQKYGKDLNEALFDDENRNDKLDELYNKVKSDYADALKSENSTISESDLINAVKKNEKAITRENLLKGIRLSGRKTDEIRELEIEAGVLPRVHGSAMFRRGMSQGLAITTLGSLRLMQISENFEGESEKRYIHHYSAPNYSVGEAGRFNFYPGNRELGHGALAEKAVRSVIPSKEVFPYTIRVVTEIMSQNGSTSMAATCASCLSLMDAGVPIKAPVAGISIGLITKDDEQKEYQLLTDVQDVEDYYGDMDFKVTGTRNGVTAIQMDTKLQGVRVNLLQDALNPAQKARFFILDKYLEVLPESRKELSKYAPRVETLKINPEKIGELIGPGGKVIRGILESVQNKVDVDIQDDGTVTITAVDEKLSTDVLEQIKKIVEEAEIGRVYEGRVDRIETYGAFVDVSPNIYGLVHVSELADGFVKDVNKHVKVGDVVKAKVIGKTPEGKVQMSIKQADK